MVKTQVSKADKSHLKLAKAKSSATDAGKQKHQPHIAIQFPCGGADSIDDLPVKILFRSR